MPRKLSEFSRAYYAVWMDVLKDKKNVVLCTRNGIKLRMYNMPIYDPIDQDWLWNGMTAETWTALSKNQEPKYVDDVEFDDVYIGSDGMVVLSTKTNKIKPAKKKKKK